ncbi:hypothetical protein [Streptomyces sp. NPDC055085]
MLSQIHPSLERMLGKRLAYPYVQAALLTRHGSPARRSGSRGIKTH